MILKDWAVESSAFIGKPGSLIPVPITKKSSIKVTEDANWSFRTTVTGRVYGSRSPLQRRVWAVDLEDTLPSDMLVGLRAITSGAMGEGPFHWITPHAQAHNLLSLDDSMFKNNASILSDGGPVTLGGEFFPASLIGNGNLPTSRITGPIALSPVAGTPVTVAAWLRGAAFLVFNWIDSAGVSTTAPYGTWALPAGSDWQKVTLTQTPPDGAVAFWVNVSGASAGLFGVAGVQAVWGSTLPNHYWMGEGCNAAAITEFPRTLGTIRPDEDYHDISGTFTVTELG